GRALADPHPAHQNDPAVGEFQRIVMRMRLFDVHLAETSHGLSELAEPGQRQQPVIGMLVFGLALEHYFGTGKQADRHTRLTNGAEAAGAGAGEAGRDQFFSDLGRAGRDVVQTIVTHGRPSSTSGVGSSPPCQRASARCGSEGPIEIGGTSGTRTRISRWQGGGSPKLSYHAIELVKNSATSTGCRNAVTAMVGV